MMLAAAILNSLGGLLILAGAWIQGKQQYTDYVRQLEDFKQEKPWRPPIIEGEQDRSFRQTMWSFRFTFASLYGWRLIIIGGALVTLGSVLATVAAAK